MQKCISTEQLQEVEQFPFPISSFDIEVFRVNVMNNSSDLHQLAILAEAAARSQLEEDRSILALSIPESKFSWITRHPEPRQVTVGAPVQFLSPTLSDCNMAGILVDGVEQSRFTIPVSPVWASSPPPPPLVAIRTSASNLAEQESALEQILLKEAIERKLLHHKSYPPTSTLLQDSNSRCILYSGKEPPQIIPTKHTTTAHKTTPSAKRFNLSKAEKKEIRANSNRLAAQRSRERRKKYFRRLQIEAGRLRLENEGLKDEREGLLVELRGLEDLREKVSIGAANPAVKGETVSTKNKDPKSVEASAQLQTKSSPHEWRKASTTTSQSGQSLEAPSSRTTQSEAAAVPVAKAAPRHLMDEARRYKRLHKPWKVGSRGSLFDNSLQESVPAAFRRRSETFCATKTSTSDSNTAAASSWGVYLLPSRERLLNQKS